MNIRMLDILKSHRSIRNYQSKHIEKSLLDEIFECGLRASSSGNMQTWSVIRTSDPEIKKMLYVAHYEQDMILQAPLVLTFCSDVLRMREWIRVSGSKQSFDDFLGFLTGAVDAAIAAQNMVIAAESNGLGVCYMGTTWWSADEIRKILELPECVFPVTSLVLGYPDEDPELRDRISLDGIVHAEKYRRYTDEEIQSIFGERERLVLERWRKMPEMAAYMKEMGFSKVTDYYTSDQKYSKALHTRVSKMLIRELKAAHLF